MTLPWARVLSRTPPTCRKFPSRSLVPPPRALPQGVKQYTIDHLVTDVLAVLRALGHPKCTLVGGSHGSNPVLVILGAQCRVDRCCAAWSFASAARHVRHVAVDILFSLVHACHRRWRMTGAALWRGTLRHCAPR